MHARRWNSTGTRWFFPWRVTPRRERRQNPWRKRNGGGRRNPPAGNVSLLRRKNQPYGQRPGSPPAPNRAGKANEQEAIGTLREATSGGAWAGPEGAGALRRHVQFHAPGFGR